MKLLTLESKSEEVKEILEGFHKLTEGIIIRKQYFITFYILIAKLIIMQVKISTTLSRYS